MRKISPFILLTLMLTACTLSMDEWDLPEEERGMDEPYTEQTPFGDVTYQFNDSVLHLTENMQEDYLVRVEHDSILYISGNIPKAYRPYVGMKIHAGFGYNFPRALNGRVIAVSDVGGIYKVVTTGIDRDAIFKQLNYCFDYEGSVDNTILLNELDDEALASLGYQRLEDSTLVDWNVFDSVQAAHGNRQAQTRIMQRINTRALEVEDKTDSETTLSWAFSTDELLMVEKLGDKDVEKWYKSIKGALSLIRNISSFSTWWKSYKEAITPAKWQAKFNPYVKLNFKWTHYIHAHTERDEAKDYESNWNETWNVIDLGLDAGFRLDGVEQASESTDNLETTKTFLSHFNIRQDENGQVLHDDKLSFKEFKDVLKDIHAENANKKLSRNKSKLPIKGFEGHKYIPVGSWFAINLEIAGTPKLELAGCFTIAGQITTAKRKSGKTTQNNQITTIDEETAPATARFTQIGGKVVLTIGYSVRAGADFLICHTAGPSIGANLEAALVVNAGLDIYNQEKEGESEWFKFSGNIKFYVDFWCDFKFVVKPLGFTLWEQPIKDFPDPHAHIFYKSFKYEPSVSFGPTAYASEDGLFVARTSVTYDDLDGISSFLSADTYPLMRMYMGPISDGKYVYMEPASDANTFSTHTPYTMPRAAEHEEYHYFYRGAIDKDINEVHFVPYLISFTEDIKKPWSNYQWDQLLTSCIAPTPIEVGDDYPVAIGPPTISTIKSQQIVGSANSFDFTQTGQFLNSQGGSKDGSGEQSIDPDELSLYKFISQVKIYNATRMANCGLLVVIYDKNKKRISQKYDIPIKHPVSGLYTYIFSFVTDWKVQNYSESTSSDECLYYRVIPYWTDRTIGEREEAQDYKSRHYYPIEYRIEDVTINENDKTKWGSVMPEVDLNSQ